MRLEVGGTFLGTLSLCVQGLVFWDPTPSTRVSGPHPQPDGPGSPGWLRFLPVVEALHFRQLECSLILYGGGEGGVFCFVFFKG